MSRLISSEAAAAALLTTLPSMDLAMLSTVSAISLDLAGLFLLSLYQLMTSRGSEEAHNSEGSSEHWESGTGRYAQEQKNKSWWVYFSKADAKHVQ